MFELENWISGNITNFLGVDFFYFFNLGLKVRQVAAYYTTHINYYLYRNWKIIIS